MLGRSLSLAPLCQPVGGATHKGAPTLPLQRSMPHIPQGGVDSQVFYWLFRRQPGCLTLLTVPSTPHPTPGLCSGAPAGSCQPERLLPRPCNHGSPAPGLVLPQDINPLFSLPLLGPGSQAEGASLRQAQPSSPEEWAPPQSPLAMPTHPRLSQTLCSVAGSVLQLGVEVEGEVGHCIGCGRWHVPRR